MNEEINVIQADNLGDFRIRVLFSDGTSQEIDFKRFLSGSKHPEIRAFQESARFAAYRIEHGELIWGDYELCFPVIDLYRNTLNHLVPMGEAA